MLLRFVSLGIVLILAGQASAKDCPDAPDHSAAFDRLFAQLRRAPNAPATQPFVQEMWALWTDAPDAQAQEVLNRGMRRRRSHDLLGALQDFDKLIAYCPEYAEGYNQRGFARFIQQDYAAALLDLDRAIMLSPRHTGALTGRALTLIAMGRIAEARVQLRAALELNPWLSERRFLEMLPPEQQEIEL